MKPRTETGLTTPNFATFGPGSTIAAPYRVTCPERIEIGARVLTASRVFIGDTYHDYRDPHAAVLDQPMVDPDPVHIGAESFVGIGSIILPGVTIGEHGYVAAGAVVTTDVRPRTRVAGNPARVIRGWDAGRELRVGTGSQRRARALEIR